MTPFQLLLRGIWQGTGIMLGMVFASVWLIMAAWLLLNLIQVARLFIINAVQP